MPRFPKAEPKIAHLAEQIADGLSHAADAFLSGPVPPAVPEAQLEDYQEKNAALARSRAEAKIRRVDKNNALRTLKDSMRGDLRYGEVMARGHRRAERDRQDRALAGLALPRLASAPRPRQRVHREGWPATAPAISSPSSAWSNAMSKAQSHTAPTSLPDPAPAVRPPMP